MAGLFAASMSSMDSALNKNSGIFMRSIYQPYLAKRGRQADDKKLLRLSMSLSLFSGIIVIITALYFGTLRELSLFDLMMSVSAMIQVPLLVPLIFGLFIKKTPQWAPWVTVMLGLSVSWFMRDVLTPQVFASWIGIEAFTVREARDMSLILTLAGHVFITGGFFCLTGLFYKEEKDSFVAEREYFFADLETPVIADNDQDQYDLQQRNKLSMMVMIMGSGMLLMSLIPNPFWGRMIFLTCALVIFGIGFLLKRSTRIEAVSA